MQHDCVKKLNFDLLTGSGAWGGGCLRAKICYHDAAFVILQHDHDSCSEKLNFDLLTPSPRSERRLQTIKDV